MKNPYLSRTELFIRITKKYSYTFPFQYRKMTAPGTGGSICTDRYAGTRLIGSSTGGASKGKCTESWLYQLIQLIRPESRRDRMRNKGIEFGLRGCSADILE
jgi:hypothetical protein